MVVDNSQSQEMDLDRTDRLPILEGVTIDEDVADDSVRLDGPVSELSAELPAALLSHSAGSDFTRPGVDLPSLAESMRSVEERIARQSADYEALNRLYEKARDAQLAAGTRADALASELSMAQSTLAVEQHRSRETSRVLSENSAAAEASRARAEESARESERYQSEARTLRDALAARDATIVQVLHSLGERDAQLFALQREHAQTVPVLEERSRAGAQLQVELLTARTHAESLSLDLKKGRDAVASLTDKLARAEADLAQGRRDANTARAQAASYIEVLRTRDWRGGFRQNMFREWDDKVAAARSGHGALQAECDRLSQSAALLTAKLAEHEATISTLHSAKAAGVAALVKKSQEHDEALRTRFELHARIDRLELERKALQSELGTRGDEIAAARSASTDELQQARAAQAVAEARHAELSGELEQLRAGQSAELAQLRAVQSGELAQVRAAQSAEIEQLRAQAVTHEEEMTVLMAHLNEARRPIQSIQADLKRLNDEVSLKSLAVDQLAEENRTLRGNLERTRGALEERELLIRRLERSANNNANALGRLQTSIERLGSAAPPAPALALAGEFIAELIKLEGDARTAYPLGRRTRIGRAPGCELQVDSQSVSRHHAMLLKGTREIIVEDLNSTNGVLVNGRKVTRQVLSDGDLLTIGETQFQCRLKPASRAAATPHDPALASSMPPPVSTSADDAAAEVRDGPRAADSGSAEPSNSTHPHLGG